MFEGNQKKITLTNTSLNYAKWKGGNKTLLCFHGFGQDHKVFSDLFKKVKKEFTIYSFDVFFHGRSEWKHKEKSLLPSDWFKIMELFFENESINEFEVMGFSMGGKFAMITGQQFPVKTNHLHLLAPDGIKMHFSYRMSTFLLPLRKLFKTQIENPVIFNELVKMSKSLKLMDNYTLRFAETQMKTQQQRQLVYNSWVVFRHFMPDLKKLGTHINDSKFDATFYIGKYDKVIDEKAINPFVKILHKPKIKLIESGHSNLIRAVAESF